MVQKKQKKPIRHFEKKKEQNVAQPFSGKPHRYIHNIPYYFLFCFACLIYANTLFNKYALDDLIMITENQFVKKGFNGIGDILSTDSFVGYFGEQRSLVAGGRYRPLSIVSFAVEHGIFGLNPFIGHLLNILLYAFACLLIYKTLKMLFPPGNKQWYMTIPFIAAMLFIAHPLHTEVVANIKGRDEIFSLLGSFGALYFILKYIENLRIINLFWASFVFFLGLMSKENVITFIVIIPLTLYFFTKSPLKKTLVSLGCLTIVTVIFIFIRYSVLGFFLSNKVDYELLNNPFLEAGTLQKYATIFLTWGKYLVLMLFPHPLTHDYYPKQIPIIEMSDIRAILPLIIYVALAVYAFRGIRGKNIISYGILFFGITFSISSNFFFSIGSFMNDRFIFVSLLGFCIVVAYLFVKYLPPKVTVYILGVILLAYSVKTIARNTAWKNDYTLFTTDVKTSANSAKCNVSAGGEILRMAEKEQDELKKKKMIEEAVVYLKKGTTIHTRYTFGWILYGAAMAKLEDYKKAREYYENALIVTPGQKEALNNWLYCAQMSAKKKDYNEAINSYNKLISYQPANNGLYMQLAGVYESINQTDSMLSIINRILVKDTNYAFFAYSKMGVMYLTMNNIDKSIGYLLQAYSIYPTDESLLGNLGVAYERKKDYKKSVEFFNKAIAANPGNPQTYINLAVIYRNMGNKPMENGCMAKAAELQKKQKK